MDTDDLTPMAYETILRARDILDVLAVELGASAMNKDTEDDFLRGVIARLRRITRSSRQYLEYWNYEDAVDDRAFNKAIRDLISHAIETLDIPYNRRARRRPDKAG